MGAPNSTVDQNLLPVQAYFDVFGNFQTFIGQGKAFYATANPVQSGLTITNSTLDSSPIGGTSPSTAVFTDMKTTTGQISTQPSSANDIVNLLALQSYAAGISWKQPCAVATLTNITLSGLQTIDTYTTLVGDRVLVKNQTTQADNGIYIASAGAWTRALDANTWNELIAAISFIEYGTQKGGAWFCTAQPGGTLGTTPVIFSQFTTSATYTAGTGLTLTGFQFSITNTGVAASTYGSATATPVFAVNAQGQITSVTNTTITPAIGNVTGLATGMLTFLQTPTSANLAATVTDETGSGALVFNTSPTFITPARGTPASGVLTNATGLPLTTGVTCTLPIGNVGTGQTTASAAFNALSPITTTGDLIYGSGANTSSRLAIGTSGQILTVVAGVPAWASLGTIVSSFSAGTTGFTPSTATTGAVTLAGTLNIANGGTGITSFGTGVQTALGQNVTGSGGIALATSPSFTTPSLGVATGTSLQVTSGLYSTSSYGGSFTDGIVVDYITGTGRFSVGTADGFAWYNGGVANTSIMTLSSAGVLATTSFSGAGTGLTGTASSLSIGGNAATATSATSATTATNATNIAITDNTSSASTYYPVLSLNSSGNNAATTSSTKLSFVPSTGVLSATGFAGALNGSLGATTPSTASVTTLTIGTTQLGAGDASIMKNRIINGAMVIDQRNAGASVNPTDGQYTLDRWVIYRTQASKLTVQQNAGSVTPPIGFSKYLGITSSSAYSVVSSDYFLLTQPIEGFNTADLGWGTANAKTVTLSFQIYSSLTGTFGGSLQNNGANRSYPFTYTISSANTWTTISVTVAGDTSGTWVGATNGVGMYVYFGLGVGSTYSGTAGSWAGVDYLSATGATSVVGTNGATFYITGVQLEVGSSATGFEYVNYQTSLANCQRYFQLCDSMTGVASSTTVIAALLTYSVQARTASPTITQTDVIRFTDAIATNPSQSSTSVGLNNAGRNEAYIYLNNYSALTIGKFYIVNLNNTGAIGVSTEL